MNNFDHAVEATETALNSASSAARENEKFMEGLEAKTNQLKSTFQQLASSVVDSGLVKGVLDLANAFLQLLNTPIGTFITQVTLLTGVLWGGSGLITAMKLIPAFFSKAAKAAGVFTGALSLSAPQLMLIAGGIAAILALAPTLSHWYKVLTNDVEYLNEKIAENKELIEENKNKIQELSNTPWYDRTEEIDAEIKKIEQENKILEANVEGWQARLNAINSETGTHKFVALDRYNDVVSSGDTEEEVIQNAAIALSEQLETEIEPTKEALEAFGVTLGLTEEGVKDLSTSIQSDLLPQLNNVVSGTIQDQDALNDLGLELNQTLDYLVPLAETYEKLDRELTDSEQQVVDSANALKEAKKYIEEYTEAQDKLTESVALTEQQYYELTNLFPQLEAMIDNTSEGYILDADALAASAMAGEQWATSLINNHEEATSIVVQKVKEQIEAYEALLKFYATLENFGLGWLVSDKKIEIQGALEEAQSYLAELDSIRRVQVSGVSGSGTGKSALETQNELYQEQLDLLKDRLEILQKSGASQTDIVNQISDIQKEINKQITWYQKQGLSNEHEYIRNLISLWWDYENEIVEIRAGIYEKLFGYMSNRIDEEISDLQKQREEEEAYWDARIEALQEQNEEIEKQIELEKLQDNLARARQNKLLVYKDGKFQYIEDVDEISQAQANLESYERDEALRQEVDNLQQLKEQALSSIDQQIEAWEEYKEQWSSVVDNYEEEQDRLLLEQELGIELEGENWKERLDNLEEYVSEYEALMARLAAASSRGFSSGGSSSGGGSYSSGSSSSSSSGNKGSNTSGGLTGSISGAISGAITGSSNNVVQGPKPFDGTWAVPKGSSSSSRYDSAKYEYASGTLSAQDGISLVGEKGPELRITKSGDGIIPADITKNLWNWGKLNPNHFKSTLSISIGNLNLPNIKDGPEFVNYMCNNFWRKGLQFQN